jgi:hypothetical protein
MLMWSPGAFFWLVARPVSVVGGVYAARRQTTVEFVAVGATLEAIVLGAI